ncbi:hypothetical protein LCGC14_0519190 [marine sediment metagenome]|uniref:Uncharacterized protein n=2 Tax=root TaxID=1 RepID=A0A9C9NH69_9HYPH|nr:hypothetical protein [Aurantimonas coralicida]
MAIDSNLYTIPGLKAEKDLSSHQFKAMELSGAFQVDLPDSAADIVVGILQNKPAAAGRAAEVRQFGITKWKAGATITVGARVGTTSAGLAVVKTANNDWFNGIALSAGDNGEIVEVLLTGGGYFGT